MTPHTIFIHCSATHPGWWADRSLGEKIREIRSWHKGRGWSDIGYHWVIDRDGAVDAGRPETRQGAHAKGHNRDTIAICLIGGHGASADDSFADHFTPAQEIALKKLIGEIEERYGDLRIRGHNEVAAKGCPGFRVIEDVWKPAKPAPLPFWRRWFGS